MKKEQAWFYEKFALRIVALAALHCQVLIARPQAQMSTGEQQQELQKLQEILPSDPPFDAWLKKTHALPPDFNSFPKSNMLPEPLKFGVHSATRTPGDKLRHG